MAASYMRCHSCPGADRRKRGGQSDGPSDHRPTATHIRTRRCGFSVSAPRTRRVGFLNGRALGHWTTRCYDKLATRSDPDNEAVSLVERTASQDKPPTSTAGARSMFLFPFTRQPILQKRIRAARGQRNIAGRRFVLLSFHVDF